ncbi:putative holin-like toxin [Lacticaseibacillus casei]|nr:putative holin-like toxin [Lacticaseibacillus casei]
MQNATRRQLHHLKEGDRYGFRTVVPHNPEERSSLVPVKDALDLMLQFGSFILALLAVVIVLIDRNNTK